MFMKVKQKWHEQFCQVNVEQDLIFPNLQVEY